MHAKRGGSDAGVSSDLREKVVRGLAAALPELELVDRELSLGEGRWADLVGVEAGQRLVLVLLVTGEGDEPLLGAAAAVAFGRTHSAVLAEHLHRFLAKRSDPLVVVVAERFSTTVLERAAAFDPRLVRWMELRAIESAKGERAYLVQVAVAEEERDGAPARERGFLNAVEPRRRELARAAMRRLARLDHELEVREGERSVTYSLGEDLLCSLVASEGGILGRVGREAAPQEVEDVAGLDALLRAVLEHHVALLQESTGAPLVAHLGGSAAEAGARSHGLPLLSREELEAFQDPH